MGDIADFLAARIYDDEQDAENAAEPAEAERLLLECEAKRGILLDYMTRRRQAEQLNRYKTTDAAYYPMPSDLPLKYLALPYRAHPEYSRAWAPPASGTVETWGRR